MPEIENYDVLVIGSGEAGKYLAWTMAGEGQRTAVVERKLIGGSCPNIACLPSKNIIYSAKVRSLAGRAAEFGVEAGPATTSMKGVQDRKRAMVDGLRRMHLDRYRASGAELIMGHARFTAPRTVEVELAGGGTRRIGGDRVFLNLGTHATVPDLPGLAAARPMTHVELLDLDRLPGHLIVMGGGYVGLELAQAMRRFGARVTVIEQGPQLAPGEDADVAAAVLGLFRDEGIDVLLRTRLRGAEGTSGHEVRALTDGPDGADVVTGTDLLVAVGRTPNTSGIGLDVAGVELTGAGYVKVDEHLATTAERVWAMGECAGSPQHRRPPGAVLHVPRPGAGQDRLQRNRGQPPGHRIPPAHPADGRGPGRDDGRPALHRPARRDLRPPHRRRGPHLPAGGPPVATAQ